MGSFITDLKNSFNKGNIYIQFIYINVGVFIVTSLLGILWMLFNRNGAFVLQYLELPAWTLQFVKQPWSLLTYMFMHAGILHLLFNMLWLYWFGQMFLSLFSAKHFRGHDATSWINRCLDCFSEGLSFRRQSKKPKMKVHYGDKAKDYDYNARKKQQSEEIDRILDKLKKSGYNSLTTEEKKSLFDASKK